MHLQKSQQKPLDSRHITLSVPQVQLGFRQVVLRGFEYYAFVSESIQFDCFIYNFF